jgi:hypothetical protein
MSIPPLPPSSDGGLIPSRVSLLPKEVEAPESEPYTLSFKHYNEKECELSGGAMDVYALAALKALKNIGMHVPTNGGLPSFGIATERVFNSHGYASLFKGIDDPEVDMREAKLEGKQRMVDWHGRGKKQRTEILRNGRIFFYPIGRMLYLVAFRANHYETGKR